ncbi:DNA polymerase III subunit beta [Mycoplasmopsis pullorum]|uniref:DNA polymerase III subunit beta n=1 Tax=Mycoplasmopsis pullorum TaxID=48003 RepID=UPI00111BBE62|nr:DNA polymerase III subunit beta [Mycoplasmopsis pullorum]TNK82558.1 DNA polymerase III subunit beta [Mycoplasmopsis pullorum]
MKITIVKSLLDNLIEFLTKYTDPINVYSQFRCINIDVNYDQIIFTASDGTISAQKIIKVDEIKIKVEEPGVILVNAAYLKNIIKKLSGELLIFSEGNVLTIKEGKTEYVINLLDAHFPLINFEQSNKRFEISSERLEKAIRNVIFAASDDDKKSILKCINLTIKDGNLRLIATDTYRLSTETVKISNDLTMNISVTGRNLKNMITKDTPKKIFVFYDDTKIGISYENTVIQSTVNDIPYSKVDNIFPQSFSRMITINKNELLRLINKVIFINQDKSNRLQFKIDSENLHLMIEMPEIGKSEASTTNFKLEGKPIEIDFNYNFIKEAINIYDDGDINLCINDNETIMLVVSKTNEFNKQLITPLRRY